MKPPLPPRPPSSTLAGCTDPRFTVDPTALYADAAAWRSAFTLPAIPRWAFVRMEEERARFLGVEPNLANVDVFMANPIGWQGYHAFAAYIARTESPPDQGKAG